MLNKLIQQFLSREFAAKTESYYITLLSNFDTFLVEQKKDLNHFDVSDVQKYFHHKQDCGDWNSGASTSTFITVLKSFCRFLRKETDRRIIGKNGVERDEMELERVRLNDIIDMRMPKTLQLLKTEQPVFLEDIKRILNLMMKDKHDKKHYNAMRMWAIDWFGCRVGEFTKIRPDMVKLEDNSIFFDTEKTNIQRMNFYDDFTKKIMQVYLEDNHLFNMTEGGYWYDIHKYGKEFGKNLNTKLGRQSFNTNMDPLKSNNSLNKYLIKKYGVGVDGNFVKVISGHTISGLGDMSMVYKIYPVEMIKDVMINHHYLKPLEKQFRELVEVI